MNLYENWMKKAYSEDGQADKNLWDDYLPREQKIYEYILSEKVTNITGTVKQLSEQFDMDPEYIAGFVDGIKEALVNTVETDPFNEDTELYMEINFETLYKKMVEYKAEHLYNLPQWDGIFDSDTKKRFYLEQKKSSIYVREHEKIGRNDPCPCGSGKKYKKCCGGAVVS